MNLIRVVSLALAIAGCASARQADALPRIERIDPDSVTLVDGEISRIEVRGSGFVPGTPGQNTVSFAGVTLSNVPASDDGRVMRIVVPTRVPSGGDAAPLPLDAGRYTLTVITPAGTSNGVVLRVGR